MRTGKFWLGGTSRLGTETEALPPGVTSCAATSSVTPRTRLGLELCSVRVTSRSSTTALPRWLTCDSPRFAEIRVKRRIRRQVDLHRVVERRFLRAQRSHARHE
jgi:hypothetical protein